MIDSENISGLGIISGPEEYIEDKCLRKIEFILSEARAKCEPYQRILTGILNRRPMPPLLYESAGKPGGQIFLATPLCTMIDRTRKSPDE